MIHFLNEDGSGNKELKDRRWFLPDGVRKHLQGVKDKNKKEELTQNHTTKEAWDHLVYTLEEDGINYQEMKRIKNWFDKNSNATKTKQYELYGGDMMKTWVNNQLNSAVSLVKQEKEAKKAMGISNAFIKPHEADRQTTVTKASDNTPTYNPATMNKQNRLKELSAVSESKNIIITEHQARLIKENMMGNLPSDIFDQIEANIAKCHFFDSIQLCKKYFEECSSRGSSRIIFEIDDNLVLKLAANRKGILQNKVEVESFKKTQRFKKIFANVISSSKNYSYIICEKVIPLTDDMIEEDFRNCLGVEYNDFINVISAFIDKSQCFVYDDDYSSSQIDTNAIKSDIFNTKMDDYQTYGQFIESHMQSNENLRLLFEFLIANPVLSGESFCIQNLGLTERNGKGWIVILDNGFDGEVSSAYSHNNFGELNL